MKPICILPSSMNGQCSTCKYSSICDWENDQAEIEYQIYLAENEY